MSKPIPPNANGARAVAAAGTPEILAKRNPDFGLVPTVAPAAVGGKTGNRVIYAYAGLLAGLLAVTMSMVCRPREPPIIVCGNNSRCGNTAVQFDVRADLPAM